MEYPAGPHDFTAETMASRQLGATPAGWSEKGPRSSEPITTTSRARRNDTSFLALDARFWTAQQLAELEFITWYLRTDPDLPRDEIERFLWCAAGYVDWLLNEVPSLKAID